MMYRPLAAGMVAARICALATSLTSTMTGVPAITSLSRQAYCKAKWLEVREGYPDFDCYLTYDDALYDRALAGQSLSTVT